MLVKKILIIIFSCFIFLFSQGNDFPEQFEELNYLIDRMQNSFSQSIIDGDIPNDVALTKLAAYGFSEIQVEYIDNIMQAIFLDKLGFRLIKIDKLFRNRDALSNNKETKKKVKGVENNKEYIEVTREVNSENYIEFYFYRFEKSILIKAFVHDAKSSEIVWSNRWSVEAKKSNFVFHLNQYVTLASFPAQTSIFNSISEGIFSENKTEYIYLGFFLGARQVGFGDYGIEIKAGYRFKYEKTLKTLEEDVLLQIGPKINLNLFELSGLDNYYNFNLYLTIIDAGVLLKSAIVTEDDNRKLYSPKVLASSSIGLFLTFDSFFILGFSFDYLQLDLILKTGLRF